MKARRRHLPDSCVLLAVSLMACAPTRYRPGPVDPSFVRPVGMDAVVPPLPDDVAAPPVDAAAPPPAEAGPLLLAAVLESVTSRYPPWLSTLLERDLASGRLQQAMGGFDTALSGKVGGRVQGYYESTVAQGLLQQPLATGDTLYGGYRISDGFLPDYYGDRTQDDGEIVFGGRFPLLQNRSIDGRRANVRQAEIDVELADPTIARARIDFVQAASNAYFAWVAAGRRVAIARELFRLASDRQAGLQRGVERQFLAPIDLTDNERLIAQRQIFVARATRDFQAAALALSLYLRDADDRPIVPGEDRLVPPAGPVEAVTERLEADVATALRQRPELRRFQLLLDKARTDRDLADNQVLPNLDLIVEGASSLSDGPYGDREDLELFVGGELKLPLQRRDARGRLQQAEARLNRLRIEQRFVRDRIVNDVADARSAVQNAAEQLRTTSQNVALARRLVEAEQRAFELGRSDLLRIQLREVQLADAEILEVDAWLAYQRARASLRAALGGDAAPEPPR